MSASFLGNIILKGKMEALTGIHIGGSKDKFEIGGVDSPVIRDPNTNFPYIPGSSLKGKMRSLLAYALGKAEQDPKPNRIDNDCPLQRIFGVGADERNNPEKGPSRLIVRDAYPDQWTIEMWQNIDSELLFTEYKPENTIDRISSTANPRFLERIVKGSRFNIEFVYSIYRIGNHKKDEDLFENFIESLRLLEHSNIGGSGSRGYGQIEFKFFEPIVLKRNDYTAGSENFVKASKNIDELIENYSEDKNHWWLRLSDFEKLTKKIQETFNSN